MDSIVRVTPTNDVPKALSLPTLYSLFISDDQSDVLVPLPETDEPCI